MIKKLIFISNLLRKIAEFLGQIETEKRYYVYNTSRNKPKYIHKTLQSALKEADRIADRSSCLEKIQVLEIVHEKDGDIPF